MNRLPSALLGSVSRSNTSRAASSYVQISRHFRQLAKSKPLDVAPPSTALTRFRPAALHTSAVLRSSEPSKDSPKPDPESLQAKVSSLSSSLQHLAHAIPSPHLRTKHELLASATSFLDRLRIHFKWFTIRGFRPYRIDDWSAFFSWVIGGVGVWIVVGTTSFMATVFFLLNSLQMQSWLARKLGNYLTASSGVTVVFESAIVPKFSWKHSTITFKNVYVSRGPSREDQKKAIADGNRHMDTPQVVNDPTSSDSPLPTLTWYQKLSTWWESKVPLTSEDEPKEQEPNVDGTDKSKWTAFHMAIDEVDVALSLPRWLDGKGFVESAVVKGVRGVIDRRHLVFDPNATKDRSAYRHAPKPGDFHLEDLVVQDFLVTLYQPNDFRPYTISIFSAHLPTLRKQWLFLDMLSAESITGQVDNCLFSLHRPQSISRTNSSEDEQGSEWKRMSRFRIDGLSIDHFKSPADTGFLAWIQSGKVDLVADVRFPKVQDENASFETIIGEIADRFDEVVLGPGMEDRKDGVIPGHKELLVGKPLKAPEVLSTRRRLGIEEEAADAGVEGHHVSMDLSIRFKEVKATLPIFAPQLSYVNNALIRPIVAFLNANKTLIPVQCHVNLPMSDFDGSWTTFDTGILDAMSEQVYQALAHHVQHANSTRVKQVGLWSAQITAQHLLQALRNWNEREMAFA